MAENPASVVNGLDESPAIKAEPVDDPLIDPNASIGTDPSIIPKEYITSNGLHEDSDCEDIAYFTQVEVDNTRKCLENTRLIIKDFETQLDWHLQQYMTLRNVFSNKKGSKKDDKRQDLLSISQLSAIIANHPEGNKKFIKRKGPVSNGAGEKKRRRGKESESEDDSDFSDESEEYDEDFEDSEGVDDPNEAKKKKPKGKKRSDHPQVKDEIEEEFHDLVEPKQEVESDDEMGSGAPSPKKTPAKRARKQPEGKTPAKRGPRGKKGQMETVDLTNMKSCSVVLNRLDDESQDAEIKDEELDREELLEMLQDQAVDSYENLHVDSDKPISILKEDNYKDFDYNECKSSNVVVTFEDRENFPEFIFIKNVADYILDGSVMLVQANVFDQYLSEATK